MKAKELAFMGKITAGATHEMNNVLATIRESGGLLQDLMGLCQDSSFPYREKFLKVLTNIDDQVRRGVELATKLNKFSHSMDNPETRIDAQTILQLNLFLMHRFARLKQVTLAMSPGDENPELVTNPFLILLVLSSAIDSCLAGSSPGGAIGLSCGREAGKAYLAATYTGSWSPETAAPEGLDDILGDLKGSLDSTTTDDGVSYRLVLEA